VAEVVITDMGLVALVGSEGLITRVGGEIPAGTLLARTPVVSGELKGIFDLDVILTAINLAGIAEPVSVLVKRVPTVVGGIYLSAINTCSGTILRSIAIQEDRHFTMTLAEPCKANKIFGLLRLVQLFERQQV
jgi:hypothetical protein